MSRSYASRRRSETMRAPRPVETPATDACTVYRQRWERTDRQARAFDVLALSVEMALEMGVCRMRDKYRQDPSEWVCTQIHPIDRPSVLVTAILMTETPAEDQLREQGYLDRAEKAS